MRARIMPTLDWIVNSDRPTTDSAMSADRSTLHRKLRTAVYRTFGVLQARQVLAERSIVALSEQVVVVCLFWEQALPTFVDLRLVYLQPATIPAVMTDRFEQWLDVSTAPHTFWEHPLKLRRWPIVFRR